MKYIKLLCTTPELYSLFPDSKLVNLEYINQKLSYLKIDSNDDIINIEHHQQGDIYMQIQKSDRIVDIDSLYTKPIQDLTIICDRKLWYELYVPLMRNFPEDFNKLENLYVENNVTVFFNFAILEALNYEVEQNEFLYEFKFNHIKLTDYELFKDNKNFFYDSFYSMYHILSEGQLCFVLNPNLKYGWQEYLINFKDMFNNLNITNRIYKPALYNHTCQKPRFHRIKFLLEAEKLGVLEFGRNNVNVKFLEEYKKLTDDGGIKTDNGQRFSENHLKYFNKNLIDDLLKIKNKINVTPDDAEFLYDHLKNYFNGKEYNEAYIEIVGETHCIFDLQYGFFTEKSIKPILSNNFCMVYGSKKVYKEYERLGIKLFLDDFGINGIQNVDELEQIQIIVNALKKLNKKEILNLYIKNYQIIENNRKILINYYCDIMNKINKLLIKNKIV